MKGGKLWKEREREHGKKEIILQNETVKWFREREAWGTGERLEGAKRNKTGRFYKLKTGLD